MIRYAALGTDLRIYNLLQFPMTHIFLVFTTDFVKCEIKANTKLCKISTSCQADPESKASAEHHMKIAGIVP